MHSLIVDGPWVARALFMQDAYDQKLRGVTVNMDPVVLTCLGFCPA